MTDQRGSGRRLPPPGCNLQPERRRHRLAEAGRLPVGSESTKSAPKSALYHFLSTCVLLSLLSLCVILPRPAHSRTVSATGGPAALDAVAQNKHYLYNNNNLIISSSSSSSSSNNNNINNNNNNNYDDDDDNDDDDDDDDVDDEDDVDNEDHDDDDGGADDDDDDDFKQEQEGESLNMIDISGIHHLKSRPKDQARRNSFLNPHQDVANHEMPGKRLDESRLQSMQHISQRPFFSLLPDNWQRVRDRGVGLDASSHQSNRRERFENNHLHIRTQNHGKHAWRASDSRLEIGRGKRRPRLMKPNSQVPYHSPVVVSISDNSYVSASPIITGVFDSGTGRFVESQTNDTITTSTTATTTSSSHRKDLFSTRATNILDLGSSDWRGTSTISDREDLAGTELHAYTLQPPKYSSNFDRFNYISDSNSYETNTPRKLSRPEFHHDNNINEQESSTLFNGPEETTTNSNVPVGRQNTDQDHTYAIPIESATYASSSPATQSTAPMVVGASVDLEDEQDDSNDNDDDVNGSIEVRMVDSGTSFEDPHRAEQVDAKYSNIIISPKNDMPSFGRRYWDHPNLASIRMVQEDTNVLNQGNVNSAIIAVLFGIGATGMLIMVVGLKMRTIRERFAYKSRRRSLVPDADFLIHTIPIRGNSFQVINRQASHSS